MGLADRLTTGAATGGGTLILISSVTVPPAPEQDRVKLVFEVKASITIEPEVALLPDQPPEASQLVVLLLSHIKVVEPL